MCNNAYGRGANFSFKLASKASTFDIERIKLKDYPWFFVDMSSAGREVTVRWSSNFQFVGFDHMGHSVVIDADRPNGEGTGMRPMALLLAALGGCTGMDIVQGLKKFGQSLKGLEVKVSGEVNEKLPHYYTKIRVHYLVKGESIDKAVLERVIKESDELFCSVGATIKGRAEILTSYEIVEV
jgi:Predicted redox protein, regulator of disulfide bond formation